MQNPYSTQPIRVLIADDEFLVVETIQTMLNKMGYDVVGEAATGQQAVELTRTLHPDVVLMDIYMPEMDGLEAAQHIQSQCPTPIVILTVNESSDLVMHACQTGVGAYLLKPSNPYELERAILIARARFADLMELRQLNTKLEWLIRDTYHRVKNNLMVVEGLLQLQANEVQDPVTRKLFTESQTRIRSMLLIHEKLHQSPDLTQVDFAAYLQRLTPALFEAYKTFPIPITLIVEVQNIFLCADTATSCGLIVNELVSNALKHAFIGRDQGRLAITLQSEDNHYVLTVSDDGIGMPDGWDIQTTTSLGIQIVFAKVRNLKGNIELDRNGGTTWKITFCENTPPLFVNNSSEPGAALV
ncbi:MAG: response regulator [Anaerolineae bacterium]|nr:response regulator [Anaerolineae bacterium]